jgi:hypothetical protein
VRYRLAVSIASATAAVAALAPPAASDVVAYTHGQETFLMTADGGNKRMLADEPVPTWAPGGGRLIVNAVGAFLYEPKIISRTNGCAQSIRPHGYVGDVSWAPDGTRFAYTDRSFVMDRTGPGFLSTFDILTGQSARLGTLGERDPAWSPDGRKIAYVHPDDYDKDSIWLMDPDGRNKRLFRSGGGGSVRDPAWSPDGSRLAYIEEHSGATKIVTVRATDAGGLVTVTSVPDISSVAYSRDGRTMFFTRTSAVDGSGRSVQNIFTGPADGSAASRPITEDGENSAPSVGEEAPAGRDGYWMAGAAGRFIDFGAACRLALPAFENGSKPAQPVVSLAVRPDQQGGWLAAADGGVFNAGNAPFYGSAGGIPLNQPIVGMAATPSGNGYWLVAADGGIFAFGDAGFFGSTGARRLNTPIVGMAATPSGKGYWLVASDGGIFTFGDAGFRGSAGNLRLSRPITGMAATSTGAGYWLVAADGGVFTFGDAPYFGSIGRPVGEGVVAIAGHR